MHFDKKCILNACIMGDEISTSSTSAFISLYVPGGGGVDGAIHRAAGPHLRAENYATHVNAAGVGCVIYLFVCMFMCFVCLFVFLLVTLLVNARSSCNSSKAINANIASIAVNSCNKTSPRPTR